MASNLPKAPAHVSTDDSNIEAAEAPRVRIILEENDNIGPTGQFFGADGHGYMLMPGEEAEVPQSIISILDTAVMSTPVTDSGGTVIAYRDRLRFPYRVVTQSRK